MSCPCPTAGLGDIFGERSARLDARQFRRHGLADRAEKLIDAIRRVAPFHDAVVLEGGAGVAGLSIELLRRGVARAVAVDAVPAAVRMARRLAEEYDVASRLEPVLGDFTALDDESVFDIVVLDRVVCCYPDWRALLEAATARAARVVALTYPRAAWWSRAGARVVNAGMWSLRKRYRTYIHPPADMHALLRARGFAPEVVGHAGVWDVCVAKRVTD